VKKYLLLIVGLCFLLVGCGGTGEKGVLRDLTKKIEKLDGYHLVGELEIINNEDSFLYDIEVSYQKENNFRVSLRNKINNHEQIILKNIDGVYVLTPSLNKSFKFQSEWPYNNSQSYLLQTILNDINQDKERVFTETEDGYMFTTNVNYSNNNNLVKQNIYVDKDLNIKQVDVLDQNDIVQMKMLVHSIDYDASYDDEYFTLKGNMVDVEEEAPTSTTIGTIAYPMFLPENTYLANQEKIDLENGERVILTFNGDNPFMVIQETTKKSEQLLTIPMHGEPHIVTGTVGALSDTSVSWVSNGIEFYVISDILTTDRLLQVANSFGTMRVNK